jgi:hypothetical protein
MTFEQRHSKLVLKFAYASRDRRLSDPKMAGGASQATPLGDRNDISDLVQLHRDAKMA